MEADWDELARIVVPAPGLHAAPTIATSIAFDDDQELLWVGNEHGRISSFHGPELQRYVSLKAHAGEGPVRQFLLHEKGVLSLSSTGIHLMTRKGLTQWHITHHDMQDLRCMTFTSRPNQILIAGCQRSMFVIDLEKGVIHEQLPSDSDYTIMKRSRYICAATDSGTINILDNDLNIIKTWKAHSAINDMDARNDFLVTCGFSVRQIGPPIVDPLANVYDLKTLRPIQPIPFHAGAAFVRLHPKLQTTSFVASQTGQMQVIDLMNPNTVNLRQANVSYMIGMELSSSGDALAISDADFSVHLWGSPAKVRFSQTNKETEFADHSPMRPPHVGWNEEPLNVVGMPYYHERLLSAWPSHLVFDVGAPPTQIDPAILPYYMPKRDGAQYTPNPRKTHRYQIEDKRGLHSEALMSAPKFLSEKAKENPGPNWGRRASDAAQALAATTLDDNTTGDDALLKYSNVEIKYSRFGVDDFDFRYYNKTDFSGLETHIANSYTNSLLQLFKFIPLVRNLALHHAATSCIADPCHLCEMGFLFDMLEKATGQNCQATNLLKTYSSSPEASRLGLLEDGNVQPLTERIENANRFLLNRIAGDFRQMIGNTEDVDEALATSGWQSMRCLVCGDETVQPNSSYSTDLIYPNIDPKHAARNAALRFSSILRSSLEGVAQTPRGYCTKCRSYRQMQKRKTVARVPFVLLINALLTNPKYRPLWEIPGWLPTEFGILVQGRSIHCFEGTDLGLHQRNETQGLMVFELVGFVAQIDIAEHHRPHLVSFINVDVSARKSSSSQPTPLTESSSNWHLFNDFLVTPLTAREALLFNSKWKIPTVLGYQIKTAHGAIDDSWQESLDPSILFHPYSVNNIAPQPDLSILGPSEQPLPETPIALDTEFVDLEKAEIDVKADGTQETIRPAKSGLARVSVLRGVGPEEGIPFIDDYITIRDPIVDYKTQYSGIRPGDLDLRTSTHNLVPLKIAYKKLWLLLNMGCVFVGHGLASDFRKINIQVPKSQTVDTQFLYLHPGKNRRLSLRYLAWAVFREYIQEEPVFVTNTTVTATNTSDFDQNSNLLHSPPTVTSTTTAVDLTNIEGHDSITDAHMALRLWRKFQEWEDAGVVDRMVDEIYREGVRYGYKPPLRSGGAGLSGALSTALGTGSRSATGSGRNTPDLAFGSGVVGLLGGSDGPGTPNRGITNNGNGSVRLSGTPKRVLGNGVQKISETPK